MLSAVNEYKIPDPITPGETTVFTKVMSTRTGNFMGMKFFPNKLIDQIEKIALTRNLSLYSRIRHPNIVHYNEVINNANGIFIIMDWCEGKSLKDTIQGFGKLPEKLIAKYISDVLQGLKYLHDQAVAHGNLKASNILLTNSIPKITDFGLSAMISQESINEHPYWTAPEVLETKVISKEGDIWSLGCTILELMTGKPPFAEFPPDEARIKIATEIPELPSEASQHLKDFLRICFNRDPNQRASAVELMEYFWITTNKRVVTNPQVAATTPPNANVNPVKDRLEYSKPTTEQNEKSIFAQLDEITDTDDLEDLPKPKPTLPLIAINTKPNPLPNFSDDDDDDDNDSFMDQPKPRQAPAPLKLPVQSKNPAPVFSTDSDSDFGDIKPTNPPAQKPVLTIAKNTQQAPLIKLPSTNPGPLIKLPGADDSSDDDFGDMPVKPPPQNQPMQIKALIDLNHAKKPSGPHSNGLIKLPTTTSNDDLEIFDDDDEDIEIPLSKKTNKRPNTIEFPAHGDIKDLFDDDEDADNTMEIISRQRTNTLKIIGKEGLSEFIEQDDDEDESDFIGDDVEVDKGKEQSLQIVQNSTRGKDVDVDNIFEMDKNEEDLFIRRENIRKLQEEIIQKLHVIGPKMQSAQLYKALTKINNILIQEKQVRSILVAQNGVLPIIEVIEFGGTRDSETVMILLSIIYNMIEGNDKIKENFCLLGGIPPVLKYLVPDVDLKIRKESIKILKEICKPKKKKTLQIEEDDDELDSTQMFIACNGFKSLVDILHYNLIKEYDLVGVAIKIIVKIFKNQRFTQQADFCRLFLKTKLLVPLANALLEYANFSDRPDEVNVTINNITKIFDIFSQSDTQVKLAMSEEKVMKNVVKAMYEDDEVRQVISIPGLLNLCRALKLIGMEPETLEKLTSSGVMDMICAYIKSDFGNKPEYTTEVLHIHSNLIMLLDSMCKFSRKRIEIVAQSRLLNSLKSYINVETELKGMALSVIMELYVVAESGQDSMKKLVEDGLIQIYVDYLYSKSSQFWTAKAINAISALFTNEKIDNDVRQVIFKEENIEKFRMGLKTISNQYTATYIEKVTGMCKKSSEFTDFLVNKEFCDILVSRFLKKDLQSQTISQIPAALLDLVWTILDSKAKSSAYLMRDDLKAIFTKYSLKGNMRQKNLGEKILKFFN